MSRKQKLLRKNLPKCTKTKTINGKKHYRVGSATTNKRAKDLIGLWVDGKYKIVKVKAPTIKRKILFTVYARKRKQSLEKHR